MKRIICLWGGPGTGKSTTAAGVFNLLKKAGYNAEMNREYIKDWVWDGRKVNHGDQVYITAKQAKKEATYIRAGLDYIITDSPLALTSYYGDIYDKYEKEFQACKAIVKQHHQLCKDHGYRAEHIFLKRSKAYNPSGRNEDEATAKSYDALIETFLKNYPINYTTMTCDDNIEERIVSYLKELEAGECAKTLEFVTFEDVEIKLHKSLSQNITVAQDAIETDAD